MSLPSLLVVPLRKKTWGVSEGGLLVRGGENFVLFFTPPPKYFGASDTYHRLSFRATMCKKKMIIADL